MEGRRDFEKWKEEERMKLHVEMDGLRQRFLTELQDAASRSSAMEGVSWGTVRGHGLLPHQVQVALLVHSPKGPLLSWGMHALWSQRQQLAKVRLGGMQSFLRHSGTNSSFPPHYRSCRSYRPEVEWCLAWGPCRMMTLSWKGQQYG